MNLELMEGYIAFNETFIALIPKKNNPSFVKECIPISLFNCNYKLLQI
jgi:hypothetical protein